MLNHETGFSDLRCVEQRCRCFAEGKSLAEDGLSKKAGNIQLFPAFGEVKLIEVRTRLMQYRIVLDEQSDHS